MARSTKPHLPANASDNVVDESDSEIVPFRYSITSYGADYPVDMLVKRLRDEVIYVPSFQRSYVWTLRTASRFIESLLLGLPVPGIFLSKEPDSGRMLVIDGQQRLKTLQYFYDGMFKKKEFALQEVQQQFLGLTYKTLDEEDRRRLDDSIIHATIVKQDEPSDDQSSVYHVFERLNTGGMQLQSQEIRACVLYGALSDFLSKLNDNKDWRSIFGQKSLRLKDQELILRFFALYYHLDRYERPIKEFLNDYMGANRDLSKQTARELQDRFAKPIGLIAETIGQDAFRPERALNASVFDGVMVGLARRLEHGPIEDKVGFQRAYRELLKDKTFLETTQTGTSDVPVVRKRIELATSAFSGLQ